ncbi:MAG: acetyl-CoA carboxylase biotin carboxyl carrier protein subunit [Rhizobacter sp.]|nr:acetyl-CoA carboxylase biotin carboxyl carrier protein subunit [Chlorobiales bacterium]
MKYKASINAGTVEIVHDIDITDGVPTLNGEPREAYFQKLSGDTLASDGPDGVYHFVYQGRVYLAEAKRTDEGYSIRLGNETFTVGLADEKKLLLERIGIRTKSKNASGEIKAPMPGLVVKIEVAVGDAVRVGQGLVLLEAMKMENEIKSSVAGTVLEIKVAERQTVEKNTLLLKIG